MSDQPSLSPELLEVTRASRIPYPNIHPFSHITFCIVAWNEEKRLPRLLELVRPVFEKVIVGVQLSDDHTRDIAEEWADIVIDDDHLGFGDATFPRLLTQVTTRWTFKLDADEWPSPDLLGSLSNATWYAETNGFDGVWIPFRSSVEGSEYEEQHAHLRLFETNLGWPPLLHSRPPSTRDTLWQTGHIRHDRSLDEMMQDYLRYWHAGRGNEGWDLHNRTMMHSACSGIAAIKGWDFVKSFSWWPEVEAIAFTEEKQ